MKKIYVISVSLFIISAFFLIILLNNNNKRTVSDIYDSVVYIESSYIDYINMGSGIVYEANDNYAYIVTCYHMVSNSDDIYVYNYENKYEKAQLVNYDEKKDIALLKIDNKLSLKQAKFDDSNNLEIADKVYALGTPLNDNYAYTLTSGIISNKNRLINVNGNKINTIQFDAPISGGNSGGPLLDSKFNVVGMIFIKEENTNGIAFAIPSSKLNEYINLLSTER